MAQDSAADHTAIRVRQQLVVEQARARNVAACTDILSRLHNTMPPGAKVVTIDQHLDPEHPDTVASIADLHMMAVCEGGRERTPEHIHTLMHNAGIKPGKTRYAGLQMLVEGTA